MLIAKIKYFPIGYFDSAKIIYMVIIIAIPAYSFIAIIKAFIFRKQMLSIAKFFFFVIKYTPLTHIFSPSKCLLFNSYKYSEVVILHTYSINL